MEAGELLRRLRSFALFKQVPDAQLSWFIAQAELLRLPEGDALFRPGEPIEYTILVIEGEYRLFAVMAQQEREISRKTAGEVSGFLPFSRATNANAQGRVVVPCTVLRLHKRHERTMLRDHYELSQCLVHELTSRVREFTTFQKQTEKMAALGKLSAGLAHELNNPASAIVRSAHSLRQHLRLQPEKFKRVIKAQLSDALTDRLNDLLFAKIDAPMPPLGLLQRKTRADDLRYLLEDYDLDDADELAERFAEFGFDQDELQPLLDDLRPQDRPGVLHWIDDNLTLEKTVADIYEASERIAKLVQSVKVYTHMDQAPDKAPARLEEGLQNTLQMLGHKLRQHAVSVVTDFAESGPAVPIYVSEMNQVWTNLIDNAIDALEGRSNAHLRVTVRYEKQEAVVAVTDNGKGIAPEAIDRIWEPFYTTKAVGKGTGLGLELARQIVVRHHGKISVDSQPGHTTFTVCLPLA